MPAVGNEGRSRRSNRGGDPLLELLLRRGADLARGHLAVLEDHQRRDRHDAVFRGGVRAFVDIELDDLDLVAERAGNLVQRRRDHAAGAAPFRPEIDDNRAAGLENFALEGRVRHFFNGHGTPRCSCRKRRSLGCERMDGPGGGQARVTRV